MATIRIRPGHTTRSDGGSEPFSPIWRSYLAPGERSMGSGVNLTALLTNLSSDMYVRSQPVVGRLNQMSDNMYVSSCFRRCHFYSRLFFELDQVSSFWNAISDRRVTLCLL